MREEQEVRISIKKATHDDLEALRIIAEMLLDIRELFKRSVA